MAGERTLPGLGLRAYWTVGSNDWETQHDPDTRKLSALVQAAVKSRVTNLPGSPTDGDIYIVPVGQTNADKIAVRDNGAWVYYTPAEGFLVHVNDTDRYVKWTGAAWTPLVSSAETPSGRTFTGTTDTAVLNDANSVIVGSNVAAQAATIPPNSAVAFPIWTTLTYVQAGAGGMTLVAGAGVTLNPAPGATLSAAGQYAIMSVVQIAANVWVATGQLEAA